LSYSGTIHTIFDFVYVLIGAIYGCRRTGRSFLKSKQDELENMQVQQRIMGDDHLNGGISEVIEMYVFVLGVIFLFLVTIFYSVYNDSNGIHFC